MRVSRLRCTETTSSLALKTAPWLPRLQTLVVLYLSNPVTCWPFTVRTLPLAPPLKSVIILLELLFFKLIMRRKKNKNLESCLSYSTQNSPHQLITHYSTHASSSVINKTFAQNTDLVKVVSVFHVRFRVRFRFLLFHAPVLPSHICAPLFRCCGIWGINVPLTLFRAKQGLL